MTSRQERSGRRGLSRRARKRLTAALAVDRDGVVRFREIGYRDWTDSESQLVLDQALRAR